MKTATIVIGDVEMKSNHSRRFPFAPDMVRIEAALVSNYKKALREQGYTVEIEIFDNLDSHVAGITPELRTALYEMPVDWNYIDPEVVALIADHTGLDEVLWNK